jgi:hypothetical protein
LTFSESNQKSNLGSKGGVLATLVIAGAVCYLTAGLLPNLTLVDDATSTIHNDHKGGRWGVLRNLRPVAVVHRAIVRRLHTLLSLSALTPLECHACR